MDETVSGQVSRRSLLGVAGVGLAAASLGTAAAEAAPPPTARVDGARRKLGWLEVSSVGFGVQNMHRPIASTGTA